MKRRFGLASVLRARQAQENLAKGAVVAARRAAEDAAARQAEREQALTAAPQVDGGPAAWYGATLAARQAQAGELCAATRLADEAAAQVNELASELTDAAIRRRSIQTLADRHAAAVDRADLAASQRALDEVAASRRPTGRTEL
jgi:hypothetical protein